jgi:hypothetical protein
MTDIAWDTSPMESDSDSSDQRKRKPRIKMIENQQKLKYKMKSFYKVNTERMINPLNHIKEFQVLEDEAEKVTNIYLMEESPSITESPYKNKPRIQDEIAGPKR